MGRIRRQIPYIILWIAALIGIILISRSYFSFVSDHTYEDSANNISEVYGQVDNNFNAFLEQNWNNLESWSQLISISTEEHTYEFLNRRKSIWGIDRFYFLNDDGSTMNLDGGLTTFDYNNAATRLFLDRNPVMFNEDLAAGYQVTIFAIPVEPAEYRGFTYSAIGISFTNEFMAGKLNTDAFSDQSVCFIAHPDGSVFLSTESGEHSRQNFIDFLASSSDLSDQELERIRASWERGEGGVIRCKIDGDNSYISFEPTDYLNYIMIGVVPESATNASLVAIQRATIEVLVEIFIIIIAALVIQLMARYRKKVRESNLETQYRNMMFEILSQNIDEIMLMVDRVTLRVDYISPNTERLLGIPAKDISKDVSLLSKTTLEGKAGLDFEDINSIPMDSEKSIDCYHVNRATGERRWFRDTIYHEDVSGRDKFIIVMSDRTKEQLMKESLEEALTTAKNANQAKSHFLSNMSHDIRTPMHAIMGFLELLDHNADDPDKVHEYSKKISASSKHLLGLINDVLDMSKIESGKTSLNLEEIVIPELIKEVEDIMAPQAQSKNQHFSILSNGYIAENVIGDKLRITQVLVNLLSNAIKYTPEGGKIDFIIEEPALKRHDQATLRFSVSDNGIGMSPEFLKTIFDPFTREISSVTNTVQGTGLGMAITKNLVELMGGTIQVQSTVGKGSTFTIELTLEIPDSAYDKSFWQDNGIDRVLLIDSDISACENIRDALKKFNVSLDFTDSEEEGIMMAQKAVDSDKPYKAVLLAWMLFDHVSSKSAKKLKEIIGGNTPLVMISAYDVNDVEAKTQGLGIDAYMSKPFFVTSLQHILSSFYDVDETKKNTVKNKDVLVGIKILASEDNALSAEMLKERMELEGAQITIAHNGKEAVELFEASKPGDFDMILMDVQMPVMDGYEATRRIRKSDHPCAKHIPIFAMTANVFAEDVQNALAAGMNAHLAKPIDMDTLRAQIEQSKEQIKDHLKLHHSDR